MDRVCCSSPTLRSVFAVIIALLFLFTLAYAKDLYKILGVEKGASQRDIQKAFHRLSLKYHPDKNPAKSAQAKFAEINNAYDILSDEEKRKKYDLYGDEHGPTGGSESGRTAGGYSSYHNSGGHGNSQGWSQFTFDPNDHSRYRFEQHSSGFKGGEASEGSSFNFPFGSGPGRHEQSYSFGFGGHTNVFGNMFENLFGSAKGHHGEGRHSTSYSHGTGNPRGRSSFESAQSAQSSNVAQQLNFKEFKKKVSDQFYTWAVLFLPDASMESQEKIHLLEQISTSLRGSIKVGYVNCDRDQPLCRQEKMWPLKRPRLLLYSLRSNGNLSAFEFTGDWSPKSVKNYCIEILPRFSKHIQEFDDESSEAENYPRAVLLTRKKETPAIWRALSGLFYGRVLFYDAQVKDDFDSAAKKFGVNSFPAIVGLLANGENYVLSSGSKLEQVTSFEELKILIEELEKNSKSSGPRRTNSKGEGEIPSLTKKNSKDVCNEGTPLCIIAVFRSSSIKEQAKQMLKAVSQKTLIRKGQRLEAAKNPVTYCVLDAIKQSAFLYAFDKAAFKSKDGVLIAYKPKKGTYISFDGPLNLENTERFVVEVLGGDRQSRKVLQDPALV